MASLPDYTGSAGQSDRTRTLLQRTGARAAVLFQRFRHRARHGIVALRATQRELRRSPERNALSLSKVFRTTAFKLSVAYLVIFGIGSAFVLGGVAWNVNGLLNEQITQTIQAEITGLAEQYEVGGIRQLVEAIDRRTRLPGSSLYLVTNYAGRNHHGQCPHLAGRRDRADWASRGNPLRQAQRDDDDASRRGSHLSAARRIPASCRS